MLTSIDHPIPARGNKIYFDGAGGCPGFGLRITPNGHKTFVLVYSVAGRQRTMRIGKPTIPAARKEAWRFRGLVDNGEDPQGDRVEARQAPDVADMIARYEQDHLSKLRASTREEYSALLKIIGNTIGNRKVAAVTHSDIDNIHQSMKARPYRANKLASVASRLFNLAIKWDMIERNPCKGIERFPEHSRERYLSETELGALSSALASHPDTQAANIIKLLLLCGARRGEVLQMRWQDIDLGAALWVKPASTTKQNKVHHVTLSEEAVELLVTVRRGENPSPFVFPGDGKAEHREGIRKPWEAIKTAAGLPGDFRIHDLRHSAASFALNAGESLAIIGRMLGHANVTTTARYSHVADHAQRRAANAVGKVFRDAKSTRGRVLTYPQG